jgi:hypothetical protein
MRSPLTSGSSCGARHAVIRAGAGNAGSGLGAALAPYRMRCPGCRFRGERDEAVTTQVRGISMTAANFASKQGAPLATAGALSLPDLEPYYSANRIPFWRRHGKRRCRPKRPSCLQSETDN